jgi:hypothetical protein
MFPLIFSASTPHAASYPSIKDNPGARRGDDEFGVAGWRVFGEGKRSEAAVADPSNYASTILHLHSCHPSCTATSPFVLPAIIALGLQLFNYLDMHRG